MVLPHTQKEKTIEILKIKLDFLTRDLKKTSDLINQLQNDGKMDVSQYEFENKNLAKMVKNTKINTIDLEKRKTNITDEIRILEKEIKKITRNNRMMVSMYVFPVVAMSILLYFALGGLDNQPIQREYFSSNYLIQNLKGDTIDTWVSWHLSQGKILYVNIVNAEKYPEKIDAIKDVILSIDSIEIDDSLLHKGPIGQSSTYYQGWSGALNSIKQQTVFYIPQKIEINTVSDGSGDIIITLTNLKSSDGFSGFTKSLIDENEHQILKSQITIYETDRLSMEQFKTILRHEFGHALGLAHSTDPEDLMHPTIETNYPYISECDIDAIKALYNGEQNSQVLCQK